MSRCPTRRPTSSPRCSWRSSSRAVARISGQRLLAPDDYAELEAQIDAALRASQAGRRYADTTQDAPVAHKLWAWLEEALWHPGASPKLQAAMLRVAAGLQGVDVQRGAADLTGRVGDAIRFTFVNGAVFQTTMIVDPRTGALLSKSNALVDPAVEAG